MLSIKQKSTFKWNFTKGLFAMSAVLLAFVGVVATLPAVNAAPGVTYTTVPFTSAELATNWVTDRAVPSGGSSSTTYVGRSDVLQLGIVGSARSTAGGFYYTEGLQKQLPSGVTAIQADLFLDRAWLTTDARAGLWGVGKDSTGAISAYPIVEFSTEGDYVGWRSWDGVNGGWTPLTNVPYDLGRWNKVELALNTTTHKFDVYINDAYVISSEADSSVSIGAVILNSYNFGTVGEVSQDYQVRWSNFAYGKTQTNTTSKDSCKGSGWAALGFRNQGLCIQYVNTGKDSR